MRLQPQSRDAWRDWAGAWRSWWKPSAAAAAADAVGGCRDSAWWEQTSNLPRPLTGGGRGERWRNQESSWNTLLMGSAWHACSSVAAGPSQEALAQPLEQHGQGAPCCPKAYVTDSPGCPGSGHLWGCREATTWGDHLESSVTLLTSVYKQTNSTKEINSETSCYFIHKSGLISVFNTKCRNFPAVKLFQLGCI